MEALTRLVSDSLARHGLDRPVDPRRLQWSRWFRCDSPHSLLVVPSKPGIFAIAEEIMELGPGNAPGGTARGNAHGGTAAIGCPAERSSAALAIGSGVDPISDGEPVWGGAALQRCDSNHPLAEVISRRMLAVIQFSEDDNMAYVLDRMFAHINPMRSRLHSGKCFVRFVVVEDQHQRRSICTALNQWMRNSAEKASGLPSDFASSLEVPAVTVGRTLHQSANADSARNDAMAEFPKPQQMATPNQQVDSGAGKNLHCPQPLPSGF